MKCFEGASLGCGVAALHWQLDFRPEASSQWRAWPREEREWRSIMLRPERKLDFDETFQVDVGGSFAIWALPKNSRQHVKFVITPSIQADILGLVDMHESDIERLENFRGAIEQACLNAFARVREKQPEAKFISLIRYDFEPWLSSRRVSYILPLRASC